LEVVHFPPGARFFSGRKLRYENCLNGLVAFALLALAAPIIQAAEKSGDTKTPRAGEAFSRSGTVIKNNVDICMVTGLRWALHPENGEDVKIYPKTKHTTDVLDRAAKNKSRSA
jgi:hypothetical protein